MRKIYITFGGSVYDDVTKKIVKDGPRLGADEVWVYDDVWLMQQEFYRHNHWLWEHHHKRGFGWYAWKPFIILDALSRLEDGDMVLFTDADTYPVADFSMLYETAKKEGVMLFESSNASQRDWCKRDCYIVMAQDDPKYYDMQHGVARFMVFEKGRWKPYQFLMEWLTYCVNPRATTFDPSVLGPEIDGFIEHRAEQAIMTNLAHKYGYRLHREADEAGEANTNDRDIYDQLFSQHNEWAKKAGNFTAEAKGSRYRNIPDKNATASAAQIPSSKAKRTLSTKALVTWNKIKINVSRRSKSFLFRITPRPVKEATKKALKSRIPLHNTQKN